MWFAAGSAVTLVVTALGLQAWTVGAASDPEESTFVPVTPCRLFDTRAGDENVGPRDTPLGAGETYTVRVTGTAGECTLPSAATAVAINLTGVGATAPTFVSVYPAGAPNPGVSVLNMLPGQSPAPNQVDVLLSSNDRIVLFNANGSIDLIGDVFGYYRADGLSALANQIATLQADLADLELTPGPQGPAGPAGPADPQGPPGPLPAANSETFTWTFAGTQTDNVQVTSVGTIPNGATVIPVAATMSITSTDPACDGAYAVRIRGGTGGGGGIFWDFSFDGSGAFDSAVEGSSDTNNSGDPEELFLLATCLPSAGGVVNDYSFGVSGTFTFDLVSPPTAFP